MTEGTVSQDSLLGSLDSFSDNPSAFLALNKGNLHFTAPGLDGFVSYRESGRYLVQFGGPFASEQDYIPLLKAFSAYARSRRRRVVAVQLQTEDARRYIEHGYTVNQIGASYAVDLSKFTLAGKKFVQLRNKVSRAHRAGLEVIEAQHDKVEEALTEIDGVWLRSKGKHTKELEFLVGETGGPFQSSRRLFVGYIEGKPIGYISYSPSYGSRSGWLHDLSRRNPDSPPGVMEAINKAAILAFQEEGADWLHFGFTPFTGLNPELEQKGSSRAFGWFVQQLAQRGDSIYPAKTQLAYKEKWDPHLVIPEYVGFQGRARLNGFLHIMRASNAV
ncbi:bifunctional lysylphosphatidylglycerol flippase/synthetase MprF [Streptomyces sp. NPDC093795]|uniref:bifunctional lysylphosphatidylglycerol flippase/synthetase MprF n=1 Tax=Streptomyces sp. NPDC093795 TaxID=3366051 RepID=UPI0037F1F1B2